MKILIATDNYIHNTSGIATSILVLCKGLRQQGHEVKVLALSNKNQSYCCGDDYFIRSLPWHIYPGFRFTFVRKDPLIDRLKAWSPDIIHAQTEGSAYWLSRIIMKYCHCPLVMTCHTNYEYYLFGRFHSLYPLKALMYTVGRFLYKPAVQVIVPSEKAANFSFLKSVTDRMHVIPNGTEIEKYRSRFSDKERFSFRKSMGIDNGDIVFVAITRLSREKNIRELISFFHELTTIKNNVKFLIVGDGPDKNNLECQAKELNLGQKVIFTGRIPFENVWRYYSAGDIFISASVFEVHSMSYIEALANGLPLLCRADEALKGVLEHGKNGFIYHSEDEFCDFACSLIENDNLRKNMAHNSLSKSDEFSCSAFSHAVSKIYDDSIRTYSEWAIK